MDQLATVVLLLGLLSAAMVYSLSDVKEIRRSFNVMDFAEVNDSSRDYSEVFLKAWNAACNSETEHSAIIAHEGTYLVQQTIFKGPCRPKSITFEIEGYIVAPDSSHAWNGKDQSKWLAFEGVKGLKVTGTGAVDGRGMAWWKQSCRDHPSLKNCTSLAPTAMSFISCNETKVSNLHFTDSPQTHVLMQYCQGIEVNNLVIRAPETSPNTDGIHIHSSRFVVISNTTIGTGDDCISIGDYISNINISDVNCGPGHGVSVGSLGKRGNFVQVENIHVSRVNFSKTTNGARIKTWQVGGGFVRNVKFENINFDSVKNPIIIDQYYCNGGEACKELGTGVHVSEVTYDDFVGTSSSDVAISLKCSPSVPCTDISLKSIWLRPAQSGRQLTSNCTNAYGKAIGVVEPIPCFQKQS